MINKDNFRSEIKDLKISSFPEDLRELHEFVVESTEIGTNWNAYSEPDVKTLVDTYFAKLNEFLSKAPEKVERENKKPTRELNAKKEVSKELKIPAKVQAEDIDEESFDFVERIPDEIKFIRRYLALHNKKKTKDDVLRFINALHKSIAERKIRKSSAYAKQIDYIQDKLVKRYNEMDRPLTMKLSDKIINEFKSVIASEKVMPSVQLIKRYINLNGKYGVKDKAKQLMEAMERASDKGKVLRADKYIKVLDKMYKNLSDYAKNKSQKILSILQPELNGLNGFLAGCGCNTINGIDEEEIQGLGATNKVTPVTEENGEAMSVNQVKMAEFETIGLYGQWLDLIGNACKPTHIFIYGSGGSGKSSLILQFAEFLNKLSNKILYVAGEQYNTPTFTELIKRLNISGNDNFVIVRDLSTYNPANYDFVALDSKDSLDMDVENFRELKKTYPEQSFIISSQGTKSGNFTGKGQWRNEVDTMIFCENGIASTDNDKNRWGGKAEMRIFGDEQEFKQAA